jgi:hypothetical protein
VFKALALGRVPLASDVLTSGDSLHSGRRCRGRHHSATSRATSCNGPDWRCFDCQDPRGLTCAPGLTSGEAHERVAHAAISANEYQRIQWCSKSNSRPRYQPLSGLSANRWGFLFCLLLTCSSGSCISACRHAACAAAGTFASTSVEVIIEYPPANPLLPGYDRSRAVRPR